MKDRDLMYRLFDIARLVESMINKKLTGTGVTVTQFRVLTEISKEPHIQQNILADKLFVGRMAVTGIIDRLEARGLVERHQNPLDRRAYALNLTDKSKEIIPRLEKILTDINCQIFNKLKPVEKKDLDICLSNLSF